MVCPRISNPEFEHQDVTGSSAHVRPASIGVVSHALTIGDGHVDSPRRTLRLAESPELGFRVSRGFREVFEGIHFMSRVFQETTDLFGQRHLHGNKKNH